MKTIEDWVIIYRECCKLWGEDEKTGNRVRLTIGQFNKDDVWAFIEILCFDKEFFKLIYDLSEKYNLRFDFSDRYTFRLREEYVEQSSGDKK